MTARDNRPVVREAVGTFFDREHPQAAVLGGALLAAVAGAAAMGATSGAMSLVIRQNEAEHLEQQVDEGHMLLFVRAPGSAEEARAVDILSRHGAFEARLIEGHRRVPERARA